MSTEVQTEIIVNGRGYGPHAEEFMSRNIGADVGRLRPYIDAKTGIPCVTLNVGKIRDENAPGGYRDQYKKYSIQSLAEKGIYIPVPVGNAIVMRQNDYREVDRKLYDIARKPQKFRNELARIGTVRIDAWKKLTYEYENVSDYIEAVVDMDPMVAGRNDHPLLSNSSTPIPFIHVDITRGQRQLGVWSNGNPSLTELDIKTAGIKIGEKSEKIAIGMEDGLEFSTISTGPWPQRALTGSGATIASQVYGAAKHPARYIKTNMTVPTGLNPQATYQEVLGLIQTLLEASFTGPFVLYHSLDWNQYMDNDYLWISATGWAAAPTQTLRQKLESIADISRVERLDFLTNTFTFLLVPDDSRYVGMIIGVDQTTVQWPSKGGMQQNWKILKAEAPYMRFDHNGYLPIYHATTA